MHEQNGDHSQRAAQRLAKAIAIANVPVVLVLLGNSCTDKADDYGNC